MRTTLIRIHLVLLLVVASIAGWAQVTTLIKHPFYDITFVASSCSPIMGYYVQTKEHAAQTKKIKRGGFRNDKLAPVECQLSYKTEYKTWNKSHTDLQHRMDEGHINPYNAFCFSVVAAKETMLFDNVCPQISHVNEQEWQSVEAEVMKRCMTYGDVKVWTGVLINLKQPQLMGTIPVPDYYWKVISYEKDGVEQEEAWLSKNDPSNTHTLATQAVDTRSHVLALVKEYYPDLKVGF